MRSDDERRSRVKREDFEKLLQAQIASAASRRPQPDRKAHCRPEDEDRSCERELLQELLRSDPRSSQSRIVQRCAEDLFGLPLDRGAVAAAIRMRRRSRQA
jgi:hypothetical protein